MVRAAATAVNMLVWAGLLFLLYVILISTVPPLELMVGAGFALLGAVAAEALRRAEHPRLRPGRRIAAAAAAFPLTLLKETGRLAAACARSLRGRGPAGTVVTLRLDPGVDAACAAALLSASPGMCVLDITAADDNRHEPAGTERGGHDLTAHLLAAPPDDVPSGVERALAGRRLP